MVQSSVLKKLNETLHASGKRMTRQRALVLEILEASDDHLDATAIWNQAHRLDESINLATVYRTLSVLKEMSLVHQRYFSRDHKREVYEASHKPEHFHFTCMSCGSVIEFQTRHISRARQDLSDAYGVTVTHACVCFEGYCSDCVNENLMTEEVE